MTRLSRSSFLITAILAGIVGCKQPDAAKAPGFGAMGPGGLPVQVQAVALTPVQQSSDFVATIKSRRSVTVMPQVSGNLTQILVKSGDHVQAGQSILTINPIQQQALVDAQRSTENQKKAVYDYSTLEFNRQRQLFDAGVTSRDTLDQAEQSYKNTGADYDAAVSTRKSLEEQLAYYNIKAPFDGIIGDIPVHVGDYVTPATALTTVDENKDLEAYIYVPTDHSNQLRNGLAVQILDTLGNVLETTAIDFLSPQIDPTLQGILVKAPVHSTASQILRAAELVKARIVWKTSPQPVVPVLAVSRQGGQSFVFVAVPQSNGHFLAHQTSVGLGETVGNQYAITSGLKEGDKVIVSGTQFLVDNMPVTPHS